MFLLVMAIHTFHNNGELRDIPAYGLSEASHYLGIPKATLRSWVLGRHYPIETGKQFFRPIIELPDKEKPLLSFVNLVESHVLEAIRQRHGIKFWRVRGAVEYIERHLDSRHPLVEQRFVTDGADLFVEQFGRLVNISREGQLAIKELIQTYLRRIERDSAGFPIRLYPFTRERKPDEPKTIVIDPYISFGRPVLAGTGIATTIIAQRYKAGESIEELVEDYGRPTSDIQEAIRSELWLNAA
ncbi:MAG: DUF433 domain-containing protein [Deltaproteobacteria bacterium]|nr:DUF433 domain-containing protein [Deltaproteobacteria bacterium]